MDNLWQVILTDIETSLSPASFKIWFAKTKLIDSQEVGEKIRLTISCPSAFVQDTIESRFLKDILAASKKNSNKKIEFNFVVQNNSPIAKTNSLFKPIHFNTGHSKNPSHLNPSYTFENFVVGPSNQVAVAAAQAIVHSPGTTYNPFFLFGDVGLGKTHLIQAIAHNLLQNNSSLKILYTTSEEFTNDLIRGLRNQKMEYYKNKYRHVDALLIDDIQFIAGKTFVQEEFFHTFNTLYMAGRQVIVTADSPPDEINGLPQRIISRFKGGLTIDIQPLDYETRRGIIEYKVTDRHLPLDPDIIDMISNYPFKNAREVEGLILKIESLYQFQKKPITKETVLPFLKTANQSIRSFNPKAIIRKTATFWGLKPGDILSRNRQAKILTARQIAMYLCRQELSLPYTNIGHIFGGKDHSTVIHSVEKISQKFKTDNKIKQAIITIKGELLK